MKISSLFTLAFFSTITLWAQLPTTINFQGNLTEPGTTIPIADGDYTINFGLFDAAVDGINGWTETQTVTVINGIFNVKLGAVEPLNWELFDRPVWLEITVAGETLGNRIELSSTPYSMNSSNTTNYVTPYTMIPKVGYSYIAGDTSTQNYPFAPGGIDLAIDDNDTGFDVLTDGTLSFYTNAVERMFLSQTGVLTIGSPISSGVATVLELNYDDKGTGFGGMWITSSSTTGRPYYGYQNGNTSVYSYLDGNDGNKLKFYNSGDRLTITSTGNVGVGNTNPPERLSVTGDIAATDTVKADVFAYNSPKVSYASVHSSGFTISYNPTNTYYITGASPSGFYRTVAGGTIGDLVWVTAPISLPHGARITEVRLRVYDSNASYSAYAELIASGTSNQEERLIATTSTSTDNAGQVLSTTTIDPIYGIVNNYNYSYAIRLPWRSGASLFFYYSASVSYELNVE